MGGTATKVTRRRMEIKQKCGVARDIVKSLLDSGFAVQAKLAYKL